MTGPKGKEVTQLRAAAKEVKAKQAALKDLFTLNAPPAHSILRHAANLLEYTSVWHTKDADGEAEADVIRLKVFKASFNPFLSQHLLCCHAYVLPQAIKKNGKRIHTKLKLADQNNL